ncbi:MAG: protein kinase [Alphaproteobacteria bacterium]|nr:protein kinase [Alphaproteobacteria bacterium]
MTQKPDDEPLEMGGLILKPGARIGGYVFMREIGSGGMARVLLAKDPAGNLVALKVLRKSRFKTGLVRFRREFRALSRIHHPNVIHVETYGDLHGHPFIAMEYVDGPDLHSLIRSFRTWDAEKRWRRIEEILIDLCRALSSIHRRGLVHRDLKPSNVLINREGVCKLTDFGIVKDLDPSHDPHLSTTLVGTWAYASPEQISGQPIDHRSDLYSLGVILFAMLTGKRPFVANDMAGYLALHRDRPAPAPRDVNREIPEHLDEITRRLLQKAPRDRYQSAQEILYRLEAEERVPLPSEADGWEAPLVGRDLELEVLGNAVAGLTARRGGVVVLEGDDGSGKSRLLSATMERARNLGLPQHREDFHRESPGWSSTLRWVRQIVEEMGNRAPRAIAADLEEIGKGNPPAGGRDPNQVIQDAAREVLGTALEDGPRLLLFDDLHEAPAREVELLCQLVRALIVTEQLPLVVVVTLRPKASPAADGFAQGDKLGLEPQQIEVGPMSREDLNQILFGLVGDSIGSRMLAQRLHKETEGNAYFVNEFLRSLMANGVLKQGADGTFSLTVRDEEIATGHLEIPIGVRQMMKARLDALQKMDRRALEVLAVAGRELDLDVLLDVLDEDEDVVLDSIERLLSLGIVRERRAQEVVFHQVTHRKFADVVYRDLDAERRSWLHRKMAAALELHYANNPGALEIVGEHYRQAGDAGRAYRYLVAAARRNLDRSLVQEAWELTDKAGTLEDSAMADLAPQDFRAYRRDLLTVRANVLYNKAEWSDAEKTYRAVLALAEEAADPKAACEARLKLATVLRRRGRTEESRIFAEQSLEASRRLHFREGVAEALHCMSALAWTEGNLEDCERLASEGLLVAQGAQLAERRAELLLALTAAQATRGHLAAATTGLAEAEGIFRELRLKRPRCLALANIAELLVWQGEPLQARQRAHVAVEIARELDYKLGATCANRAMSVAAMDLGLYDEAAAGLQTAVETAQQIDLTEETLAALVALTQLAVERGWTDKAREHGAHGFEKAVRRDPERYLPVLQALVARAEAPTDYKTAKVLMDRAEGALADLPVPRRTQVQLHLAYAALAGEDRDAALRNARAVLQTAGSRGFRLMSLEARAQMARLTDGEEQKTHRAVGQELARDFTSALAPDMTRAFARRPFLRYLEDPSAPPPPEEDGPVEPELPPEEDSLNPEEIATEEPPGPGTDDHTEVAPRSRWPRSS